MNWKFSYFNLRARIYDGAFPQILKRGFLIQKDLLNKVADMRRVLEERGWPPYVGHFSFHSLRPAEIL